MEFGGATTGRRQGLPPYSIGLSLYTGQQASGPSPRYGDLVPLARAAEAAGFDAFWVSEHHSFDGAYLPSPLVALAAVAAATERITLGTGLVLAPLAHPLRLAEDSAVVDHLSGGRLVLGIGNGYVTREFAMFGVPMASRGVRLEETVEILRRAWRGERFSFHGTVYSLTDVRVQPGAFHEGGIPIWIGAYASGAIARAGRIADGHLVGRGTPELRHAATSHLETVRDPADPTFTFGMNLALVGDHPAAAPESARAAYRRQQRSYELTDEGSAIYDDGTQVGDSTLALGGVDRYVQVHGGTEELAHGIATAMTSHGTWVRRHVALRALFPTEDLQVQLGRIEYLGSEVLPAVRRRLAAGNPA